VHGSGLRKIIGFAPKLGLVMEHVFVPFLISFLAWLQGGIAMSTVKDAVELKSPVRKLVRFFRRSRDRWKAKHHELKQKCRRLAHQASAVEKSREQWRAEALQLRHRVSELETELTNQKKRLLPR
jgi:hypothetical protein